MKKQLLLFTAIAFLWAAGICLAGDAPHQVAVFKLNGNIADMKDYVIMETTYGDRRHKGLTDPSRFTMNLSAMKCSASPMSTGTRNPTTRRWLPCLLILQNESPLAKLPEHTSKFTRQALSTNVDGCAEPLS